MSFPFTPSEHWVKGSKNRAVESGEPAQVGIGKKNSGFHGGAALESNEILEQ